MKILIFSDSHGSFGAMMSAMEREGKVDMIIHAGDVCADIEDLQFAYPRICVAGVRGNNDYFNRDFPDERTFEVEGVKIFVTHGHIFGVKYSLDGLVKAANERGADLCVFGHTHINCREQQGSVVLYNPGRASRGYGVLICDNGKFTLESKSL